MIIVYRLVELQSKIKHLLNVHPLRVCLMMPSMVFWVLLIQVWQEVARNHFFTICGLKVLFQKLSFLSIWIRKRFFEEYKLLHLIRFFSDLSAASGGELIFGGVDSSKYTGLITYLSVAIEGYWEFQMNSVSVGSTVISSSAYAIADTGTTFIIGPTSQVNALNAALGGTYDSSSGMVWIFLCYIF